ncbi:MAG TPA: GDSL-type esterase/lipase family protein [Capsulimonadaceae bacterium]|jgi:lysophospholipase L1-like esterase
MNCFTRGARLLATLPLLLAALWCAAPHANADGIVIKSGQKLAFLGDSITQFGWGDAKGYVHLVVDTLAANGVTVTPVPAGISGHTSKDMLGRLDRDVLSKAPDFMTVSCGVNDVWHGATGVAFGPYMDNMTAIIDKARAAKVQVIVLTSTPIFEDAGNDNNKKLAYYNSFLQYLAKQKGCLVADLNKAMWDVIAGKPSAANYATRDGVHMNDLGNQIMARGILQALGLTEEQIVKTIPAPPPPSAKPAATAAATVGTPTSATDLPKAGNFAIKKTFTASDPNLSGWNGLTDGTWGVVAPAAFATGKLDTFPKTITIDLQQSVPLASLVTASIPKAATKTVEVSLSQSADADFKVVGTHEFKQDEGDKYTFSFPTTTARYVRLTFKDHYPEGLYDPKHILLQEVEVYGPDTAKK